MVKKCLFEAYMIPAKAPNMQSVTYADMSLADLQKELAKAEEQMTTARPQMHSDVMWSKWMRDRITNINNAIRTKKINEHYVDTSWSREGLEPEFPADKYPVTYSQPHMQMVGAPAKLEEVTSERTIVFTKEFNPSFTVTIKVSRDGRISDITNERKVRFPYSKGQPYNRGLETWACINGYLMDGKNMCGEKKVFGVKVSDYPQGHPVRLMYPGKFK